MQRNAKGQFIKRQPEPVFIEHPPVINHPPEKWHHQVPYPYRLAKWDGPWLFVLMLTCMGLVWKPWLLLAGFIAFLRCWVWLCFRFPLTMTFFTSFFIGLLGGGRRRRW